MYVCKTLGFPSWLRKNLDDTVINNFAGYVCVRGFDQKTRAPRPLMARLHFPASKMPRGTKGKGYAEDE